VGMSVVSAMDIFVSGRRAQRLQSAATH
jgi:hypothetical protein